MTWTRHSDDYTDRPAIMALSDAAYRAHSAALIWCNRQLTGGDLPAMALPVVMAYIRGDRDEAVAELEKAGLWVPTETGWEIDWADQEDAEAVRARRERNARRQADFRERSSRHRDGDHSLCDPTKCKANTPRNASRNALRNGTRHASRNGAPTHPYPTHPIPSSSEDGNGQNGVRRDADASTDTGNGYQQRWMKADQLGWPIADRTDDDQPSYQPMTDLWWEPADRTWNTQPTIALNPDQTPRARPGGEAA